MRTHTLLAVLALTLCETARAWAAESLDWPAWRGPQATGSVAEGRYPVAFDPASCRWSAVLPGKGCSTPIVRQGVIYLTAPVEGSDALLAIDAEGALVWQTVFGQEDPGKHRNGSGSNASPVTDGQAIYAYFKSGTLAALELDGDVRWQTNLVERFGPVNLFWDHGTSPVLTERYVLMARMHDGESWLAAFDKTSGEIAWKVSRDYETPVECDHGYSTPLVIEYAGQEAVLVWGAEHATIHAAADGSLLWSCGDFNPEQQQLWPAIATPVIVDDMLVVAYGRNDQGAPRLHGVRLTGEGDVTQTNHVWQRQDAGTFVPSPLVVGGQVVLVGDQGEVECLDPATGATIWRDQFPRSRHKFYASPLVAGELLYAPREDGVVFVASIADGQFRLLAENDMGESVIGSPVPFGDAILLRGEQHLFCVPAER